MSAMIEDSSIEERLRDLETLMHEVIKGRIRTDLLFQELERFEYIPKGSNALADKLVESYERKYQSVALQETVDRSKIIPLAYGRRLAELRDEMVQSEQDILDLAVSFQRWGKIQEAQSD